MLKKISYLLFIIFLSVGYVSAQKAKISGTVYDFDSKPMDFVSVAKKNSIIGTFTNSKGKYQITANVGDSITLVFSSLGYQTAERTLFIAGDMNLNIIMHEDSKVLDEVQVIGEQAQTTTMGKIDPGNAKLLPTPGGSIEALVAAEMGVTTKSELSSQYSVRGGNYDENIVYVNGIEVYRPLLVRADQQEGLSFINPDMTGSVGFSSGGYDAQYGDKMASVLDITYKTPKSFEASASASILGASAYVGSRTKKFTQITGIRYKTTKALLGTTDTDAEYDPEFVDIQTYLTYEFVPKWEISFLGNYASNVYKFTPKTRKTKFGTLNDAKNFTVFFDGWEHDKFLTAFGALTLKGKIKDNLELGLQASAFSSDERERYDVNGEYKLTDANLETENGEGGEGETGNFLGVGTYHEHARNQLRSDVINIGHFGAIKVSKHNVKWGLSLQTEKIDDKIKEWEMRDSAGYSLPSTGNKINIYSNLISKNKTNSTRFSGYLQDTYRFGNNENLFTLNVGVRGSYWTFNKEFLFSPRASFSWIPVDKGLTFRFATGVYYQAPFYKEYQRPVVRDGNTYMELNKDIKSQKSIHFVLGGDYQFKAIERKFKFTGELYYKKLSNLNPYTVDNVKIRYLGENIGSGYIMGIDTKLFGEFVEGTDSWVSFSLMKAQQDINGTKVPLPTDQRFNISLFFQDYLPGKERLKMSLIGHFSQGLPTTAPHTGYEKGYFRSSSYKRLDIGFSWELLGEDYAIRKRNNFVGTFKNIWIGVDIFNLFDISNINSYYWVTDIFNQQYAVPNYLTGRQLNIKFIAEF
ncbi:MAG: TonB-dependent receptor [Dysgonomonas sp.]